MRGGRTRIVIVAALSAWLSCTAPPVGDDVSPDAGGNDVRDATSADAEPDARDGAQPDVYFDDAGPPEWVSIRGSLPDFCVLDRAMHPERLNDLRVRMSPCDARDNCLESAPMPGLTEGWLGVDGTYALGTGRASDGTQWMFVSPLDGGPPLAAYRGGRDDSSPYCALVLGAVGGGRAAFGVKYTDGASLYGVAFYLASIIDAATITAPVLDDRTHFSVHGSPQALYVSDAALIAWISSGYYVDVSSGAPIAVYDAAMPSASEESVSVAGGAILFQVDGPAAYLGVGQAGVLGGSALYHASAGNDARAPRTDGTDIAWLQFPTGDPTGTLELWTAPFVTDAAAMVVRHVRDLDAWTHPEVGAGMWVEIAGDGTPTGPHHYELYDLTDGRARRYDMPDSIVDAQRTLFVASDRIIYPHGTLDGERLVQFDPRVVPYTP